MRVAGSVTALGRAALIRDLCLAVNRKDLQAVADFAHRKASGRTGDAR